MARPKTYIKKISFDPDDRKEKVEPPVVPPIREILNCKNQSDATKLALEGVSADCLTLQCSYQEFVSNGFETPHFKTVLMLSPGKYESRNRYAERLKRESHLIWPNLKLAQHVDFINILDKLTDQQMKLMKQYVRVYKQLLKVVSF